MIAKVFLITLLSILGMIAFVSSLYDYFSAWADEKSFFHRMSPVLFRYQFVIPGEIDVSIIDKLRSEIRTLDFMPNKESGTIFSDKNTTSN